jgi:DNA-binding transcriptional LysR family regulator
MRRNDRYKDIQLTQLRGFCLAAAHGNFTTAARELGLSVPTVWEQVRALERKLGATLMRRHGHAVEVTAEGRLLLDLIQPSIGTLEALETLFASRRTETPQHLSLAATPYYVSCHLVRPVQEFTAAFPCVRLNLIADPFSDEMIHRVERGQAELGLVAYSREGARSAALDYEDLFELELVLMTAPRHPLAGKKRVTPFDLVRYPMIRAHKGSFSRKALDRILQAHDLEGKVQVVMENNVVDIVRKYVAAGIGIALLYVGGEGEKSPPGVRQRVFDPQIERIPVALVARKEGCLSKPAQEFRRILLRFLGSKCDSL